MNTNSLIEYLNDKDYNLNNILYTLEWYSATHNCNYIDELIFYLTNFDNKVLLDSIKDMLIQHIPYGDLDEGSPEEDYIDISILIYTLILKNVNLINPNIEY